MKTKIETGITNIINFVIQWFQELPYKIGYFIGEILGNIIKFGENVRNWVTVELPQIIDGIIQWFKELPRKDLGMSFKYNK